jgi:hypothetical protein
MAETGHQSCGGKGPWPRTAAVKKLFDAMVEAEAAFKADLEKLLKAEGHMPTSGSSRSPGWRVKVSLLVTQ